MHLDKDLSPDDQVDLSMSENQSKIEKSLEISFNLLKEPAKDEQLDAMVKSDS